MSKEFIDFLETAESTELISLVEKYSDIFKIRKEVEVHSQGARMFPFIAEMLTLIELRAGAKKKKFPQADRMLFTKRGLEQATGEYIAAYKASMVAPKSRILLLCTGIGGELLAFAKAGNTIVTVDMDPEIHQCAQWNARAFGVEKKVTFITSTVEAYLETHEEHFDHIWMDPDRRDNTSRFISLEDYNPNIISLLPTLLERAPKLSCKVAPGIPHEEIEALPFLRSLEYIEDAEGLKECVLHFERAYVGPYTTRCTMVLHEHVQELTAQQIFLPLLTPEVSAENKYIFEASPGMIRSGVLGTLGDAIHGTLLDSQGALLLCDEIDTLGRTWGEYFYIYTELPFSPKALKAYIKEKNIKKVIIKKRYFPLEPQELRKLLKCKEGGEDIFFATTRSGEKKIYHCKRVLEKK